jgi:hypothetical protein
MKKIFTLLLLCFCSIFLFAETDVRVRNKDPIFIEGKEDVIEIGLATVSNYDAVEIYNLSQSHTHTLVTPGIESFVRIIKPGGTQADGENITSLACK